MTNEMSTKIEALRTFAMAHNEVEFAQRCTDALGGEEWAQVRVTTVMLMAEHRLGLEVSDERTLKIMRATDTTRPDGAVARSFTL